MSIRVTGPGPSGGTGISVTTKSVRPSCSALMSDAPPQPAAAATCSSPVPDRRPDPPGVRPRPEDWRGPQAGYLQGASQDTRARAHGDDVSPGCAPPRCQPRD